MRIRLLLGLLVLCPIASVEAQQVGTQDSKRFFDITLGMGVGAHSAPSIVDYINAVAQPRAEQRLDEFTSAVEFFVVPELQLADEWSAGIEYSLLLKSYSLDDRSGYLRSDISYQVHMPTVLVQYLLFGEGYRLKVGGGVGYHLVRFNQNFYAYGSEETFRAEGLGVKLSAIGNTQFDETFYGSIGIDLRWDFLGTLKRGDGSEAIDRITKAVPKMNFFTLGLKFGIMFQL
ncbi:MAG: hypothetical protein AABZ02_10115 [Bacteroidota bacterium]|jgi:hypothetical protein